MVRGNTRQIVVVKSPDGKLFEQAFFLLREDALERHGVTERELLEEARRVADSYVQSAARERQHRLPGLLLAAMGAFPVALAWLITTLL